MQKTNKEKMMSQDIAMSIAISSIKQEIKDTFPSRNKGFCERSIIFERVKALKTLQNLILNQDASL